jgi:mannose-6-phosphate isomerase
MCTEGEFTLVFDGVSYNYHKGDTVLIPAAITQYQLTGSAAVLEIYIK